MRRLSCPGSALFAIGGVAACFAWCFTEPAEAQVTTTRVAFGLSRPVWVTAPSGDTSRVFIIEQHLGRIRILKNGTLLSTPFLTVSGLTTGSEQGLLGLAFHPDYASNRKFYVYYTTTGGGAAGRSVVAEYLASTADPDLADAGTARNILTFNQPYANHNAGWIAFGPADGYLHIASGDGGSGGDPGNNAQDITSNLLGKILRVDINGDDFPTDPDRNYAIPPTNPFVGLTGDDEIWSFGLRNPWRNDFDNLTGDLYIADVGQENWEEINFEPAGTSGGRNYGWRLKEGHVCYNPSSNCDPGGLTNPLYVYSHASGCSITGGVVYRGAIPELQGHYFFSDYCNPTIYSFKVVGGAITSLTDRTAQLAPGGGLSISGIVSFGKDAAGEVYICDLFGGEVFKIVPAPIDSDGDGVFNALDLCPNTIACAVVDSTGCPSILFSDTDRDGDVDATDQSALRACLSGEMLPPGLGCSLFDHDADNDVDQDDYAIHQRCFSGTNVCADPACDD